MATNIYSKVGEMEYDGLITNVVPNVVVNGVAILQQDADISLKRGTVIGKTESGAYVEYASGAGQVSKTYEGDGSTKAFTDAAQIGLQVVSVTVDGEAETGYTWDSATGKITFTTAPADDAEIVVVAAEAAEPYAILCDDVLIPAAEDAGDVVDVTVYVAGCFDQEKVEAAASTESFALSDADVDALRKYGIVFKNVKK